MSRTLLCLTREEKALLAPSDISRIAAARKMERREMQIRREIRKARKMRSFETGVSDADGLYPKTPRDPDSVVLGQFCGCRN